MSNVGNGFGRAVGSGGAGRGTREPFAGGVWRRPVPWRLGRPPQAAAAWVVLLPLACFTVARGEELSARLDTLRAVGTDGAGSPEAARACRSPM